MNEDLFDTIAKIDKDGRLGYEECAKLYRFWALGRRLVERIVSKSFSVPREISFGDDAPPEIAERFERVAKEVEQEKAIRQALILSRIFGQSVLYLQSDKSELSEQLTPANAQSGKMKFKAGDPLAVNIVVNQNPQSLKFLSPESVRIGGNKINPQRAYVAMNGVPMYLQFQPSAFAYSGRSVFENQLPIIRVWAQTLRSMGRMADRASAVYAFFREFKKGGLSANAAKRSLECVKTISETGGVAMGGDDRIDFPTTSGIGDLDQLMQRIEREVVTASDTPLSVLLDERLANGFGNGSEDFKTIIQDINEFRDNYVKPLYDFSDTFVMWRAFDNAFLSEIISEEGSVYKGHTPKSLRNELIKNFSFEFGNLYPASKKEEAETKSILLDVAAKAVSVGVVSSDIQEFINSENVLGKEVEVTTPLEPIDEEEDLIV